MRLAQVTVTVRNPGQPEKTWDGLFLVDTGAADCPVPSRHLQAIGIQPRSQRTYELADDAEPILGVTALESVGIEVDPHPPSAGQVTTLWGTSASAAARGVLVNPIVSDSGDTLLVSVLN